MATTRLAASEATLPSFDVGQPRAWRLVEQALAWVAMVLIGSRYVITQQFAIGYPIAFALVPLWWRLVNRRGPRLLFASAALATASGALLTFLNPGEREVDLSLAVNIPIELLGVLACAGCVVWGITVLGFGPAVVAYALGMLAFVNRGGEMYASDPWRLGYALPASTLVLGLAILFRRWWVELLLLVVVCGSSMLSGSRSVFGIQLVAIVILILQRLGRRHLGGPRNVAGSISLLGVLALAVYNLAQALLLEGYLGEQAQARSEAQLSTTGSLLLGGRPELAATLALIRDSIWGFGLGVKPLWQDIEIARVGMWSVGYDPLNGYVENYMFGSVFRLHSMFGDLWASFGLGGLLVAGVLFWMAVQAVQRGPRPDLGGDALLLVCALRTIWNLFFAPWYSSLSVLVLLLALLWAREVKPLPRAPAELPEPPPPRRAMPRARAGFRG